MTWQTPRLYIFRMTLVLLLVMASSQAQEKFIAYFEPSIGLDYDVTSTYTHSFGIDNRTFIYRHGEIVYYVKQLELSHLSELQIHPKYALGLGFLYRFKHVFDVDEDNEIRLQEHFVYSSENPMHKTEHRIKLEQRFYTSQTKHRFRYQLGYTFMLAEDVASQPYLKADTESLLELAKSQKPEFEQRVGVGFGWSLNSKTTLEVGAEYQLEDYTQDLIHELFLMVALGITL